MQSSWLLHFKSLLCSLGFAEPSAHQRSTPAVSGQSALFLPSALHFLNWVYTQLEWIPWKCGWGPELTIMVPQDEVNQGFELPLTATQMDWNRKTSKCICLCCQEGQACTLGTCGQGLILPGFVLVQFLFLYEHQFHSLLLFHYTRSDHPVVTLNS